MRKWDVRKSSYFPTSLLPTSSHPYFLRGRHEGPNQTGSADQKRARAVAPGVPGRHRSGAGRGDGGVARPGGPAPAPAAGDRGRSGRAAHRDPAHRERHGAPRRGRGSLDAGRAAARSPRADRHQDRLRSRRVRRLHGAARRQAGLLVQQSRGVGRRPAGRRRSRGWPATARSIRCSRRSSSTTRRSAASAPPAS